MAPVAEGFWGEPTSLVDWCEKNYEVTPYIAEFWNTVSNLALFLPPFYGLIFGLKDKFETRFIACHAALICVGLGSWLFHMTLQWWSQLLDEMPMIWGTTALIYSAWEIPSQPNKRNYHLLVFLLLYCSTVTWLYVSNKEYIYFEIAYGSMVVTILVKAYINLREKSSLRIALAGTAFYFCGLILWNIDNRMCSHVTTLRENLFQPFRPFTQLHAWWHLFAGMGTYLSILSCTDARMRFLKRSTTFQMFLGVPVIRRADNQTD